MLRCGAASLHAATLRFKRYGSDQRQLHWRPAQQVASLQAKQGGIACVDVQAHITAMQAKVMAALLHPHRHAWKLFMRANLELAVPGVGVRMLLQQQSTAQAAAAQRRRLSPRHAAHVAAFKALGLHRRLPHSEMSVQQIQLETVLGNHSIANAITGGLFSSVNSLPSRIQPRTAGTTLGQVAAQLSYQPAEDGLVLPAEWQHTLQQQTQPPAQWEADGEGKWVWQRAEGDGVWWEVQQDGSLECLDAEPALPPGTVLEPCCVVFAPIGGPRKRRKQRQPSGGDQGEDAPSAYYFVGLWRDVQVDPSVWGFGPDLSLLQYAVRDATRRLVQFTCRSHKGWVPNLGVRPRVWCDSEGNLAPDTGLQQLEAKHKRKFAELMQGGFSTGSSSGSSRRITTADQMAAYDASWMHASPNRQHVRQRVAAREATAAGSPQTALRQQQEMKTVPSPVVDDTEDPLSRGLQPASEADAAWGAAYRRAADKRLPRPLRVLGWRLLHAAVRVGDSRVYAATNMQELLQCCCTQRQCQLQQPSLSGEQHQPPQQRRSQGRQQQQQQPQQPGGGSQSWPALGGGSHTQQHQLLSGLQQSQPQPRPGRGTHSQQQQQQQHSSWESQSQLQHMRQQRSGGPQSQQQQQQQQCG